MVAPPTFVQPGPGLTKHFQEIGEAVTTPIVLQDYPPINGVALDIEDMVTLVHAVPQILAIKVEDPPTPHRISQLVAQLGDDISIVGGLGGVYLLDELRCGSHGTMTGFAYPEALAAIWQAWADGDHGGAAVVYHKYLPLLHTEGQPKLGLALRKEILRRRGWIAYATVRNPGPKADAQALTVLSQTLADVAIDRAVLGGSVSAAR
jgi:4-hydroxy-tetrahydrodipicolinate synthase